MVSCIVLSSTISKGLVDQSRSKALVSDDLRRLSTFQFLNISSYGLIDGIKGEPQGAGH
jgi:hypothetical protein